ncbi:BspA family leucine-rich repeat surface protein, partial [Brachyspira pulli]|uniref:BspA family leucine-rich repeat surface protein n=1 Tax=Brachyspira pulli TaxID=310721 RepID=UPI00300619C5
MYKPKNKTELKELVEDNNIYLGDIDTSLITDMSNLFHESLRKDFEGIEKWDTSNVTDMLGMFSKANKFNQPLNNWNTSKVINMEVMFYYASSFNQNINSWNVSEVKYMNDMFFAAESFNQSIENWDINKYCDIKDIFSSSYNDMKSILKIYFIAKGNYKKQLLSMLENCNIKEVYKEVLKYNKLKDFIKKLENIYYEELKELIENKKNILNE